MALTMNLENYIQPTKIAHYGFAMISIPCVRSCVVKGEIVRGFVGVVVTLNLLAPAAMGAEQDFWDRLQSLPEDTEHETSVHEDEAYWHQAPPEADGDLVRQAATGALEGAFERLRECGAE